MIGTGLKGLDKIVTPLYTGDNVLLQIDAIHHYKESVGAFVRKAARTNGGRLISVLPICFVFVADKHLF